jgi:hypothetical protein
MGARAGGTVSAIDDVLHLRARGFWPDNTIPGWALAGARAQGARPEDPQVLLDAVLAEHAAERDLWRPRVGELEQLLATAASEKAALEQASRSANLSRNAPPKGPLLLLLATDAIGVGRNTDAGVVVLWSEPANVAASGFRRWLNLNLITR